jgi:nucleoid-associated protein YgaU
MGLFDFFRKGKEEENKPKTTSGSLLDLDKMKDRPAATSSTPELYEIRKGDSLSAIAKREYGDASKWRTIYEANRDVIKNPDLIYPGQKIKIPKENNNTATTANPQKSNNLL